MTKADSVELLKQQLEKFRALSDANSPVPSDAAYFKVLQFVATEAPSLISSTRSNSDKSEKSQKEDKKSKRKPCHSLIKGFVSEILSFIGEESVASPDAVLVLLEGLPAWIQLLGQFPESRKKLAERLVGIWSSVQSDKARLVSLLSLHKALSLYPKLLARILPKMIKAFGQACRTLSIHTMGTATFLLNGLVEVFTLEAAKGSELAGKALKQLAALLMASVKTPTKDSMAKVYCWTFIWKVRFLARLVAHAQTLGTEAEPLKALSTKVLSLIHTCLSYNFVPRFYAHHYHLIISAAEICRSNKSYFPASPFLLSILERVVSTGTKPETGKPKVYDFTTICKIPKNETGLRSYLDCAAEEALFLLVDSLSSHAHLPGFLDLATPIAKQLRAIEAINKTWKIAKLCGTAASKLEQHAKAVAAAIALLPAAAPAKIGLELTLDIKPAEDVLAQFYKHAQHVREQRRKMVAASTANQTYQEPDLDDSDVEAAIQSQPKAKKTKKGDEKKSEDTVAPAKKAAKKRPATEDEELAEEVRKMISAAKKGKSCGPEEDMVEEFDLDNF